MSVKRRTLLSFLAAMGWFYSIRLIAATGAHGFNFWESLFGGVALGAALMFTHLLFEK